MTIIWILGIVVYLAVGLFFQPYELPWKWYNRILIHIFWLPMMIFAIIIIRLGGLKIM